MVLLNLVAHGQLEYLDDYDDRPGLMLVDDDDGLREVLRRGSPAVASF